jgi:hypothetical protein
MVQIHGVVAEAAPTGASDGSNKQIRVDTYGAVFVRNNIYSWAEESNYFKATNTTFGTGITMGIQATFSDTANVLMLMRNGSATKKIIPHYIRLICTVAGASTTNSRMAVVVDTVNRYSSGGTNLFTNIVNANSATAATTEVDVLRFAAITAGAAVAKRQLATFALKNQAAPCWTIGDEVLITFGDPACGTQMGFTSSGPSLAASGTQSIQTVAITKNVGPLILQGQNHCLLLHMWNTANATTAPSWEVEMAWWERD